MKIARRIFIGSLGASMISAMAIEVPVFSMILADDSKISTEVVPEYYIRGMINRHDYPTWATDNGIQRTKYFVGVVGDEIPNFINNQLLAIAEQAQLGELFPLIARRVTPGKTGYLIRVNTALFEGTRYVSGNLVEAVGVGREPLDALAEAKLHGEFRSTPLRGIQDTRYMWCTVNAQSLSFRIACANVELSSALERQAGDEARRRKITGGQGINDIGPELAQIERATYWQTLSDRRMLEIEDLAKKIQIETLNRRFESSQQRCNELYAKFQQISAEIAAQNAEAALINNIGSILGGMKSGLQAMGKYMEDSRGSSASDSAWRDQQMTVLRNASATTKDSFNSYADELRSLDQELSSEWQKLRIDWEKTDLQIPQLILH